tara:strand:- start:1149 stop:1412 length:264 start_codon:yes stop_codon:yes gene_type:complete
MSKTINVTIKKKTIQSAWNELKLLNVIGAAYAEKRSPMSELLHEIKREVMKQKKQDKQLWRELLDFWPLSIVVPLMLLSIILAPLFQ